jgi:hypothetical protein
MFYVIIMAVDEQRSSQFIPLQTMLYADVSQNVVRDRPPGGPRRSAGSFGRKSSLEIVLDLRFQVLTAASMTFRVVFWDILPCKMIVDRRFRGAYCLHHP